MFLELFDFEFFFSKEIIFQNFNFFEINVSCKFYAFPEKTVEKQTHIDRFSLKKNPTRIYLAFDVLVHY